MLGCLLLSQNLDALFPLFPLAFFLPLSHLLQISQEFTPRSLVLSLLPPRQLPPPPLPQQPCGQALSRIFVPAVIAHVFSVLAVRDANAVDGAGALIPCAAIHAVFGGA